MKFNFKSIIENRYFYRLVSDIVTKLTVTQKINILAKMVQILVVIAIGAGLVGMILFNISIKSMNNQSIQPLDELRATKYALEYDVIQVAKDLREGKMDSGYSAGQTVDNIYAIALKRIEKADKTIQMNWNGYASSKDLADVEKQKLPAVNASMSKALESMKTLEDIVKQKDFPRLMDFVDSEMPFMLVNMAPKLDDLMQIQVAKAKNMYETSRTEFKGSFAITVGIYLLGALIVMIFAKVISNDIIGAIDKLIGQSELIAANKLDEPFIWNRPDELGLLGSSFEFTRKELENRTIQINRMTLIQKIHIEKLTRIATALSSESHMPTLLELILDGAKELTSSDGGTLYLKSSDGKSLNFHVVKTSSLDIAMGGTHGNITWPSLPLYLEDGSPNKEMVAALSAITGEVINIHDVYEADGFNFEGTKRFDAANNFRSKSMLVIPLRNHEDEIIGVLQLINKLDENKNVLVFDEEDKNTSLSLASQAAMAITNRILIKGLEDLLMAFIESIAKAIDAKSPYTGGHVRKVAEIATELAKAISDDNKKFPHVKFSDEELKQIHIAGLMHDIGKISTPVHIVDKATKLETIFDRIEYVILKCELFRLMHPELSDKVDSDIEFLKTINKGGEFMSDALIDRLKDIASQKIVIAGVEQNLLTDNEVYNLSIKKGTLTKEDRDAIIGHAALSLNMLETLPFPKKLARIPEIAGNHHEQPSGRGYPRGLNAEELSLESRIMAIADIFEALTASDRPYKDGKKLSECFKILEFMAKDNEIDAELLKFYYESGLYKDYARTNLKEYQIDEVEKLNI